jgi:NAD(P)H-dependent flavin oxidoreductase YrpB (nitropropane dioxygenase family)
VNDARGVAGQWDTPIVGAPLGGGPSTPALAAAVSNAGGRGFVAAGYKTVAAVHAELDELSTLTSRPAGINLYYPVREQVDTAAIDAYADRMRREGERYGVASGEPQWTDSSDPRRRACTGRRERHQPLGRNRLPTRASLIRIGARRALDT